MGSPESDDDGNKGSNNIDPAVGGLVWVRRRNGSWWPGRILGLDEVSEDCLVSPKSGTPVKLLGRDDASVDWYNLEKSKRVKAFRCGEYDECIEKAKASVTSCSKKAVKYARREDAILHALELESARVGKNHPDYWVRPEPNGENSSLAKESPVVSHSSKENEDITQETSDSEENSDSAPELSRSGISFEEPNHVSSSKVLLGKRRKTPNDSEDDGMEGSKRMRGLEDLGMGVGSKRKVQAGDLLEAVKQENGSLCNLHNSNGVSVNGGRSHSTLRRKRSQVTYVVPELLKKKNRRRPLTKVLESTAMVSVPVICDKLPSSNGLLHLGLSDSKTSAIESNESRKSLPTGINNNSDSTVVSSENGVPLNASEQTCDTSNIKTKEGEISSVADLAGKDSRLFDVPFVGDDKNSAGLSPAHPTSSHVKSIVGSLGKQCSQGSQVETVSLKSEGLNESGPTISAAGHVNYVSERIEKGTSKWQSKGKRKLRQISKNRKRDSIKLTVDEPNTSVPGTEHHDGFSQGSVPKVDCEGVEGSKSKSETQELRWSGPIPHREPRTKKPEMKLLPDGSLSSRRSLPFRQTRFTVNPRYQMSDFPVRNSCGDSGLYDVEIEVKGNYIRQQHVPLVSLMSKLNGKAIIGHPLTVEPLPDGHCNNMEFQETCESVLVAATTSYHPVRRSSGSARRPSTKHMKKLSARHSSNKRSRKSRKSGLLSKKIRKLSSLTSQQEKKLSAVKPKAPVIACIPLNLVFSRINEALNGSARPQPQPPQHPSAPNDM